MAWIPITRRDYLFMRAIDRGVRLTLAVAATSEYGLSNPDVDMDEKKTWPEWEKEFN